MTTYFQNKFRNETIRLQNWDYRWDGSYFITICTKNREHFFGEIVNGKMHLSNIGVLADIFWYEIKNHAKNIKLDAFVVMPNHIHAILTLNGGYIDDDKTMMDSGEINVGDNGVGDIMVENQYSGMAGMPCPYNRNRNRNRNKNPSDKIDIKILGKIPFHRLLVPINLL